MRGSARNRKTIRSHLRGGWASCWEWRWASRLCSLFVPVLSNGWVIFDDDENFLDNVDFRGLGWAQISWAWTTFKLGVYQPLGWMLLELEYILFGLNSRGYHATSLVLHAVVAVAFYALIARVLFRLLSPTTPGQHAAVFCASSLAAAIFAVHPLRVEVVAWASCQPYLPSALFSVLGVLTYLHAFDRGKAGASAGWWRPGCYSWRPNCRRRLR